MYEKFTEGSTSDFTDKTLNASNSSSIQLCFSNISCHMLSVAHVEIIITHPTFKQSKMKILFIFDFQRLFDGAFIYLDISTNRVCDIYMKNGSCNQLPLTAEYILKYKGHFKQVRTGSDMETKNTKTL